MRVNTAKWAIKLIRVKLADVINARVQQTSARLGSVRLLTETDWGQTLARKERENVG